MALPLASAPREDQVVRAFVVAGGRSSRMGRDKALLLYRGSTLLEIALAKARAVTKDVQILSGPTRRYEDFGVPVLKDAICGVGPLGGLYSALLSASIDGRERVLWLAVDVPLVPYFVLRRLVDELDHAEVAMARTDNGIEPLCAAFRTEPALSKTRASLLNRELKLTAALVGLTRHEVRADVAAFANINSPGDLERLPG